jgi:hypothetical protein
MPTEFVKVTEHFGYRKLNDPLRGHVFAVYRLTRKQKEPCSAFVKEAIARRECRFLEILNYGGAEDGK